MGLATTLLTEGSSPLTRGKPTENWNQLADARLIPAHAGKTYGLASILEENRGSSPLTRGKHVQRDVDFHDPGLIPAHAGKTLLQRGFNVCGRAHPRSRGENPPARQGERGGWGSSPLTRGKPASSWGWPRPPWLIPAHAGKTATRHTGGRCPWAHPRSRGENSSVVSPIGSGKGSSPLTRGKH